jgi:hypothetical protein
VACPQLTQGAPKKKRRGKPVVVFWGCFFGPYYYYFFGEALAAAEKIRWPPNPVFVLCLILPHMMPVKPPAGPKEAVRTEAMRLLAPFGI